MPTAAIITWSGQKIEPFYFPSEAKTVDVRIPASTTLAKGTVLGELTATPGTFAAYADANADGTGVAKAILPFDIVTDAAGLVTLGNVSTGDEWGGKQQAIPVYVGGFFKTSELVGLDAAAVADLNGAIIHGTVADGVLKF